MNALLLVAGLVLLIAGAEGLVRGASRLATMLRIPPLVIGLTVVAFGTSAPELAVSVKSALGGQADLAVGNVIGSNIFNILLILGLSALIAPLTVARQLVRRDVPLMIGLSVLFLVLALDGRIDRLDGLVLVAGLVAYLGYAFFSAKREPNGGPEADVPAVTGSGTGYLLRQLALVVVGLALLVLGARWLVSGATSIATAWGVSELVIGLTIIAVGTSLPEVATSVLASLRGERDIAVGNVVGSNIFNILAVMGLTATVAPLGVPVSVPCLAFDLPVMVAVSLACLPIFFTGYEIARWEGGVFLGYYVLYTVYIVMSATHHEALPYFSWTMQVFVLPITVLTIAILALRACKRPGAIGRQG